MTKTGRRSFDSRTVNAFQVQPGAVGGGSATHKAGRNTLITALAICCSLTICWSLNEIMYFLTFFGFALDFGSPLYHFSVVLVFTNSCVNPFIYAAKYRQFQEGVKRMMSKIRPG